jgi:predicted DNA-binding protein (UPF0251 family)
MRDVKIKITRENFERAMEKTRFKGKMSEAMFLVFVAKLTQSEAARKVGVSRQAVSTASLSFRRTCNKLAILV